MFDVELGYCNFARDVPQCGITISEDYKCGSLQETSQPSMIPTMSIEPTTSFSPTSSPTISIQPTSYPTRTHSSTPTLSSMPSNFPTKAPIYDYDPLLEEFEQNETKWNNQGLNWQMLLVGLVGVTIFVVIIHYILQYKKQIKTFVIKTRKFLRWFCCSWVDDLAEDKRQRQNVLG